MPESALPKSLPAAPVVHQAGPLQRSTRAIRPSPWSRTGCPGDAVIIERAEQVSSSQLLWVQVRSDQEKTAEEVLHSVGTHGALG